MKLRSIILTAIASLAVFASCDKPVQLGEPQISVDPAELTLDEAASTQTVALTATRMWKLDGQIPEWMTVTPTRGDGSNDPQTITIEVKANEKGNRSADLNFTIGLFDATLKVAQAGPNGDNVETMTIAEFLEKKDTDNEYQLTGWVSDYRDDFVSFDLKDDTGSIKIYSIVDKDQYKSQLDNTAKVTLSGKYFWFNGGAKPEKAEAEIKNAQIISIEPAPAATPLSISEFISKKDYKHQYILEGTISGLSNAAFKGFDIVAADGSKVSAAFPRNFDEMLAQLADGKQVKFQGVYSFYEKKQQAQISGRILEITGEGSEVTPDPDKPAPSDSEFASSIVWTLGKGAYDITSKYPEFATFNGETAEVSILKIGSGNNGGDATLTIPEGTKEIGFYAFAWASDESVSASFDVNGTVKEIALASNAGLSGTEKPYKITVAETDYYTLNVEGATTVKVSSPAGHKRFALAAVKATK